jgi:hypothetical protein
MTSKVAEDDNISISRVDQMGVAGHPTVEVDPKIAEVRVGNIEG